MFSKTCDYALRASVFVTQNSQSGRKLSIPEIAREIESPEHFTGKILQTLVKEHIIQSSKGPGGGFYVDLEATPTPVMRVLEAFGCEKFFYRCALGLKQCSDRFPCPMHEAFKPFREGLKNLVEGTTIQMLAAGLDAGHTRLSNSRS